jgi:sugar/nucleoside kinase (ribokinase family)
MASNSSPGEHSPYPDRSRVAVLGDAMIDYAVQIDSSDSLDEKHAVTASVRSLGGNAANAAAAVTRICGPGSAELFATVSDDAWGQWIIDRVRTLGVGVQHVTRTPGATPHAVIVRDGQRRYLLVDRGVADEFHTPTPAVLAPYRVVYVSNPVVALPTIEVAPTATLVAGVEHQMIEALSDTALARAGVLVTNAAGWLVLQHRNVDVNVVETRGACGVRLHRPGVSAVDVEARPVEPRDPTGAGDAFAGALCAYLAHRVELLAAVHRANAVASVAVTTVGATLGPLDLEYLEPPGQEWES